MFCGHSGRVFRGIYVRTLDDLWFMLPGGNREQSTRSICLAHVFPEMDMCLLQHADLAHNRS